MFFSLKNNYGFTLVEIIISMSILAISSAGIIGLMNNLEDSREFSEDDSMIQIQFNHVENYIRNHIDPTTDVAAGTDIEYDDWDFSNDNPGVIKLRYRDRNNMTQHDSTLTTDTDCDVVIEIDRDKVNNLDGFIDDMQRFTIEFYLLDEDGTTLVQEATRTLYTTTDNYFMP
mgnify:CR=1 FL=1